MFRVQVLGDVTCSGLHHKDLLRSLPKYVFPIRQSSIIFFRTHSINMISAFCFIFFYLIINQGNIKFWSYCFIPYLSDLVYSLTCLINVIFVGFMRDVSYFVVYESEPYIRLGTVINL